MPAIGDNKYISLTTFRKNGDPVASPVWVLSLEDGTAAVVTEHQPGKVKRLRSNPAVEMRPCDVRGRVAEGASVVTGSAVIEELSARPEVGEAILAKYGILGKLFRFMNRFSRRRQLDTLLIITSTAGF